MFFGFPRHVAECWLANNPTFVSSKSQTSFCSLCSFMQSFANDSNRQPACSFSVLCPTNRSQIEGVSCLMHDSRSNKTHLGVCSFIRHQDKKLNILPIPPRIAYQLTASASIDASILYNQERFSDLTLQLTDGTTIKVHKTIICTKNKYFDMMCGPDSHFAVRTTRYVQRIC